MLISLFLLGGASALAPTVGARFGRALPWFALVPAAVFVWLLLAVSPGDEVQYHWFPGLRAEFVLQADPLGRALALLVCGVGTGVVAFASSYLAKDPSKGRFLALFFFFMTSMVGVALADHVLTLFLFWELTSISSYLLIGYKHESVVARRNALQALLVTGFGGVVLLVGLLLMGSAAGTMRLSELAGAQAAILASPWAGAILVCVLIGAFTKSAQFPFHFWLPNAMAAPTPVSAFLHSATMVKAGVFLLARLEPIFGSTAAWQSTLLVVGLITFILGGLAGFCQTDLKRVLAYTTLAILGALTALLGMPGETATAAFFLLFLAHALYKASLFIVVGNIDHALHERDWRVLGGLRRALPWTAAAALLALLSKAGMPPLLGFLAKEKGYLAALEFPLGLAVVVGAFFLLGNVLMTALALRVGWAPFWRSSLRAAKDASEAREGSFLLWGGALVLAVGALPLGLFPGWTQAHLLDPLMMAVAGTEVKLKLYHGLNLALGLSVLTILGGYALYRWSRSAWWVERTAFSFRDPCERLYDAFLWGLVDWAGRLTRRLQNGDLRQYVAVIVVSFILLVGYQLWRTGSPLTDRPVAPVELVPTVAGLLIVVGALGAVLARGRFLAITWLSVTGFATSWWFLYYSGPDLALTLLSVETLTLLLLAVSVRRLPDTVEPSRGWSRFARATLAGVSGLVIAVLLLKAKWIQLAPGIGAEMIARSVPEGKGGNVVNVILVDFRALDTLGEITVLALAALGVMALLGTSGHGLRKLASLPDNHAWTTSDPLLGAAARTLAPVILLLSLVVLYRGHNLPGGGFIGGLVAVMGLLLWFLAEGRDAVRRRILLKPQNWMVTGLALATVSALWGLAFGRGFFAAEWLPTWQAPVLGKILLGTPLVFDVGVYLVVIGFSLTVWEKFESLSQWKSSSSS
jgi:multicomponent Na+:H+ antiporter subunit A